MLASKIKNVKYLGKQETCDITVNSDNHIYYANGIVTSNSHAVAYAEFGYETAWVKAHFPEQYVCAWLRIAKNEAKALEEIRAMISEARRLKIDVRGPSIRNLPKIDFFIKKGTVFFGMDSIKSCSEKTFKKLIASDCDFKKIMWADYLVNYSHLINKPQTTNMIRVGCFDSCTIKSRIAMEYEYHNWLLLTENQKQKCREVFKENPEPDFVKFFGAVFKAHPRLEKFKTILFALEHPSYDLSESNQKIIENEKEILGINISCSKIDQVQNIEIKNKIKEVVDDTFDKNKVYSILGEISDFRDFKIKTGKMMGQTMASFKISDDTGELDVVCFPDTLDIVQAGLFDGNVVYIHGKKSNRGGLILEKLYEV